MLIVDNKTHKSIVDYVPDKRVSEKLANYYTAFSDGSRLRILCALSISAMCVNDLAEALSVNQTTLSHQLRILRNLEIVKSDRKGKVILYSLSDKKTADCLMCAVEFFISEREKVN